MFHILIKKPIFILSVIFVACAVRAGGESGDNDDKSRLEKQLEIPEKHLTAAAACIDGEKALGHVRKIVDFGQRLPSSEGIEKTRGYIIKTLSELGLEPSRRDFVALTPHPVYNKVEMANIVVDIKGQGTKKILLGGHYDGKTIEGVVFLGANDGGSSTGLLLEMARCLGQNPTDATVRIAFFDGEEALVSWSDHDGLYGSKRMAADLVESNEQKSFTAMVNIDMIGDARLRLVREELSSDWVLNTLFESAERLGFDNIVRGPRGSIEDDHVPFLRIGIPSADLIDLNFGPGWTSNAYWHTSKDTVDKLSAKSLQAVGEIVLDTIPKLVKGR